MTKTIGVLSLQGAISEHLDALHRLFSDPSMKGRAVPVRNADDVRSLDGLIIPGGESTTISRILVHSGIGPAVRKRIEAGDLPILGTCAGCVLLAKQVTRPEDVTLLAAMDMEVERNAFGRQCQSFEAPVTIDGFASSFPGVFIRAPLITRTWGSCTVLAKVPEGTVMARQGHYVALAFHPELTSDLRIHRLFADIVADFS